MDDPCLLHASLWHIDLQTNDCFVHTFNGVEDESKFNTKSHHQPHIAVRLSGSLSPVYHISKNENHLHY